jgi:hypothetical protein
MKKVKIIVAAILVVAVGAGIFWACKKEFENNKIENKIKLHKSNSYYNQELIQILMEDPIVDQLTNVIYSIDIQQQNGILKFQKENDVNAIYDTLIYFSNMFETEEMTNTNYEIYTTTDSFPKYPILYAFEVLLNFNSLNSTIEDQLLSLEAMDGIPLENNPDDHYIVSSFMRALLSPNCELIIDSSIYLYGDDYSVEIPDLNFEKLEQTKILIDNLGETEGMIQACSKGYAIQILKSTESTDCCDNSSIKYSIEGSSSCPRTFSFNVSSYCNIKSYSWSFGDNSYSNENMPQHTYNSNGNYTVTVQCVFEDGSTCTLSRYVRVKACSVTISDFKLDLSGNYNFSATVKHCDNANPISYSWNFGDNLGTSTSPNVQYQYLSDGNRYVILNVTFSDGCFATCTTKVHVKGTGICCKALDTERNKEIYYCNNSKRIKHVFSVRNIWPFHRIVVKSINYKIKSNGNSVREKASSLSVGYSGLIYDKDCLTNNNVSDYKSNAKKDHILLDDGIGRPFRVQYEGISSFYSVTKTNCSSISNTLGLKLHKKNC